MDAFSLKLLWVLAGAILLGNDSCFGQDQELISRVVKMRWELAARDGAAHLGDDGWTYLGFDKTSPEREYAIAKQNIKAFEEVFKAQRERGEIAETVWADIVQTILKMRKSSANEFMEQSRFLQNGGTLYRFSRNHRTETDRFEDGLMIINDGKISQASHRIS